MIRCCTAGIVGAVTGIALLALVMFVISEQFDVRLIATA